ncbi:transposase [Lactobacillus acetotolerans]|uniref:Transposase n=1 Tax=Lactobacillus acetotolerans TaxID=1600 RepID=A0A0D6A5A1_9LACO|nr:transposase [Lactobacillus acetotolerans]BAQ58003.1 transposase [Lactobacillus acetotolerans]BAQ58009.1 transposase [Lactobacillus acetotolerans]
MIALHAMHLRQVQNVLVDGGYSGVNFQLDVASNLNAMSCIDSKSCPNVG